MSDVQVQVEKPASRNRTKLLNSKKRTKKDKPLTLTYLQLTYVGREDVKTFKRDLEKFLGSRQAISTVRVQESLKLDKKFEHFSVQAELALSNEHNEQQT